MTYLAQVGMVLGSRLLVRELVVDWTELRRLLFDEMDPKNPDLDLESFRGFCMSVRRSPISSSSGFQSDVFNVVKPAVNVNLHPLPLSPLPLPPKYVD